MAETAELTANLRLYAALLAEVGLNVQKHQRVNLVGEACHRELLYLIAQAAFRRGARDVTVQLLEPRLEQLRVQHLTAEQLRLVPPEVSVQYEDILASRGANLRLVGPESPTLLEGLDPKLLNVGRVARFRAVERFYKEGIGNSLVHWTVAAAATHGWASRLFPNETGAAAYERLWQEIFTVSRLHGADYSAEWSRHNAALQRRAARLTSLGIRRLHFQGPGTDLFVGLSRQAVFRGGAEQGPRGVAFQPNIPTEECFTTPDWRMTTGTVAATRPFLVNGTLIEGLRVQFENGVIAKFEASRGESVFREYIQSDIGASRLGEIALVGIDSPVYQAGHVFEEILLDENAACHFAVGSAYKFCLANGERMEADELDAVGCNDSSVHTDVMITSAEVQVDAITYEGQQVPLIRNGEWTDWER